MYHILAPVAAAMQHLFADHGSGIVVASGSTRIDADRVMLIVADQNDDLHSSVNSVA